MIICIFLFFYPLDINIWVSFVCHCALVTGMFILLMLFMEIKGIVLYNVNVLLYNSIVLIVLLDLCSLVIVKEPCFASAYFCVSFEGMTSLCGKPFSYQHDRPSI